VQKAKAKANAKPFGIQKPRNEKIPSRLLVVGPRNESSSELSGDIDRAVFNHSSNFCSRRYRINAPVSQSGKRAIRVKVRRCGYRGPSKVLRSCRSDPNIVTAFGPCNELVTGALERPTVLQQMAEGRVFVLVLP
jgi:hypothetical protein